METNAPPLIAAFDAVYRHANDTHLALTTFDTLHEELSLVATVFQVAPEDAVLLSVVLGHYNLDRTTVKKLAEYVGLSNLLFLPYMERLNRLKQRHILVCDDPQITLNSQLELNEGLLPYLIDNKPIPEELLTAREPEHHFFEFLSQFNQLSEDKDLCRVQEPFFNNRLRRLLLDYASFPLVKYIRDNLPLLDAFVFIDTIADALNKADNNYHTSLETTVEDATFRPKVRFEYMQAFLLGTTPLNRLQLVEKNKETFANRVRIRLTDKALKLLHTLEGITLGFQHEPSKFLQYPNTFPKIKLLYNPDEQQAIGQLDKSLSERSFTRLQARLRSRNLPVGMNCLLYGAPGTGKTATVYQLARKHQRAVFKVEIAETKSMWYGESQKLIKKVFTNYYEAMKTEKRCPILLFNEADAVLGKRKASGSSSVSDTDNAIQNILLEEFENFTGILFATSNLVGNLDAAFERRFLYKVLFTPPGPERAAQVWKLKFPRLTPSQCRLLSEQFDFSPGQIENVVRKALAEEIISGVAVGFPSMVRFCQQERWQAQGMGGRRIGY